MVATHLYKYLDFQGWLKIVKAAYNCNPDIKIYQMSIDPKAFRLKKEIIN
jgi:hypothetical protein